MVYNFFNFCDIVATPEPAVASSGVSRLPHAKPPRAVAYTSSVWKICFEAAVQQILDTVAYYRSTWRFIIMLRPNFLTDREFMSRLMTNIKMFISISIMPIDCLPHSKVTRVEILLYFLGTPCFLYPNNIKYSYLIHANWLRAIYKPLYA